ncbi:lamin tail domain-containing protein [Mucisphaera calidilacus]|uniref:LTD domain-containing protein n=1 Tax=Mucisphaera calidilacus TaxID=2527982 RepID=A0A518BUT8_9BACT|nr:lamin tail domain-containing protein [Mucisphaera calidilacus]QDU70750.1 hypothetical protein Pan265_05850 [Mucisphaera calidilacus]
MRTFTLAAAASLALAGAASADLIISEIVDGPLSGGTPKFVELTNTGNAPVDLANYSLGNINNGATTMGFDALVLSGILAAGDSYVVSYENSDAPGASVFFDVYSFDADNLENGSFINGDDVLVLFSGAGLAGDPGNGANVVDVFGVVGVNGDNEPWDYTDSYAVRVPTSITANGGVFNVADFVYGGRDGLEGADDAAETLNLQIFTSPGTHAFIPEPASLAMIALGGLALVRRSA